MKRTSRTGNIWVRATAMKPARAQARSHRAELQQLARERDEAEAKLRETQHADAATAKKMEALTDAAMTARGQALDAALERSKAQGELRALLDAIEKAPGLTGWLVRRAAKRIR
ncbi:MAG: hypothetical protein V4653_03055 [Pseudomonadota bacterium]